jgi:hypothetical protein
MKNKLSFLTLIVCMFVFFIGLISFVFQMTGWKFYLELIIFLGLLLFALISLILIFADIKAGYTIAAIISAFILIDLLFIYFRLNHMSTLMFASIITTVTGFVVSISSLSQSVVKKKKKKEEFVKTQTGDLIKTYTPGKVVSSKKSGFYHLTTCDWAQKIKKSNQVWWDSEEEAKKGGLQPHLCAK